jgi:hypothetical protein
MYSKIVAQIINRMLKTKICKEVILDNLKRHPLLMETDFLWKLNLYKRKKVVKKSDIINLI